MNRSHCNFVEESHFKAGSLFQLPWQQSNRASVGWLDGRTIRLLQEKILQMLLTLYFNPCHLTIISRIQTFNKLFVTI